MATTPAQPSTTTHPTAQPVTASLATPPAAIHPPAAHPTLTVSAVARRLGIAPATLRTWDRRYNLGPGSHAAGSHRRYTHTDVRRLELMRRLTLEGVAPADAARIALASDAPADVGADGVPSAAHALVPGLGGPRGAPDAGLPATRRDRDRQGQIPPPRTIGRVPVQHGMAISDGAVTVRGLARAAMALDPVAVTEIIELSIQRRGTLITWEALLTPFFVTMGDRIMTTGEGVEVEHLVSHCVCTVFGRIGANLKQTGQGRPVLLAGVAGEQHVLPLFALCAALAERRVPTRMLGACLPAPSLGAAMRRSGPAVVFLWAQLPRVGTPAYLDALPSVRPAPILVLGGPGWDMGGRRLPNNLQRVRCLSEAVDRVVAVAGT